MLRRFAVVLGSGALFAQTGANVLLVVNDRSEVSRQIGEYYAAKRSVPSRNVCRLRMAEQEEIDRATYDDRIAKPVSRCLKSGKLQDDVLYIVTTLGVPLKIAGSSGKDGDAASVDSELALLYQQIEGRKPSLKGPSRNPFFGQRDVPFRHPQFPMYLVTRLAGYSLADVKAMIDRSLAAQNRGLFVFDLNADDDANGNNWLRTAAILLPATRVELETSPAVVYGRKGVIGYGAWGSNDKARKRRLLGFDWLPGAIATEYVSTNGRTFERPPDEWTYTTWQDSKNFFAGSPQGLTADLIREGATGASGHVYEPFLELTPRPDYLFPAYYAGRNLADSFYLSIPALSWMNIVVGDPLCRLGKPE